MRFKNSTGLWGETGKLESANWRERDEERRVWKGGESRESGGRERIKVKTDSLCQLMRDLQ